jgi:hypothetical protein
LPWEKLEDGLGTAQKGAYRQAPPGNALRRPATHALPELAY